MKKEHDVRIDRTKLHPWLDYKLTVLLKKCAKKVCKKENIFDHHRRISDEEISRSVVC